MRKVVIGFIMTTCLGMIIDLASAAYVIKLKNGNEYITNRYWQDDKQVLFETYDGSLASIRPSCRKSKNRTNRYGS